MVSPREAAPLGVWLPGCAWPRTRAPRSAICPMMLLSSCLGIGAAVVSSRPLLPHVRPPLRSRSPATARPAPIAAGSAQVGQAMGDGSHNRRTRIWPEMPDASPTISPNPQRPRTTSTPHGVQRALRRAHPSEALGPDGIIGSSRLPASSALRRRLSFEAAPDRAKAQTACGQDDTHARSTRSGRGGTSRLRTDEGCSRKGLSWCQVPNEAACHYRRHPRPCQYPLPPCAGARSVRSAG